MSEFRIRQVPTGLKFDLHAANGQVIATSEVYTTRASCLRGMDSIRRNATAPVEDLTATGQRFSNPKFQVYQDKAGFFRFRMKSTNGRVIAISEPYTTKASCLGGVDSVKRNAPTAEAKDDT